MNKAQRIAMAHVAGKLATVSAMWSHGKAPDSAVTEASKELGELVDSMLEDAKKGQ